MPDYWYGLGTFFTWINNFMQSFQIYIMLVKFVMKTLNTLNVIEHSHVHVFSPYFFCLLFVIEIQSEDVMKLIITTLCYVS